MTEVTSKLPREGLIFKFISAKISEKPDEKKHVVYTLQAKYYSDGEDPAPSVIERRYTQYQILYDTLRAEYPSRMVDIQFPKKVLMGNFDNQLITERGIMFARFLNHLAKDSELRKSRAMQIFLQEPELTEIKQEFELNKNCVQSMEKLENTLVLLNKVFSDRSHAVLLLLCRLIAYAAEEVQCFRDCALKYADLALYRFDGVSDSDILELYIPLLHACITIYEANEKSTDQLKLVLEDFRRRGIKDSVEKRNLLAILNEVEKNIYISTV